ncbi:MAG: SDR family oxidoreductase [Deltaproteobacteria bacterium]|nr:SDR family oxidoreductase [Deltaproteobacteria bacterium]MBT6503217.1 SDR family oxidoreductase [Deltaproteobacteria bacterium]MBT6612520.1 SDR family oxidoreductase [Deltaproteobacteria bacterium]
MLVVSIFLVYSHPLSFHEPCGPKKFLISEAAGDTCDLIITHGSQAKAVVGDITEPGFGDRIVNETIDHFGGIDIIVNNAGYIWNSTIQKHTDEQWYAMLDIHATAPFRILRAAAKYFREASKREQTEGRNVCRKVVNISSVSGQYGSATQLSYSAGKAALIGITKTLAKEWGRYNVTVNCITFGYIQTRLTQTLDDGPKTIDIKGRNHNVGLEPDFMDLPTSFTSLGRSGTPEEAAGAAYLFCIPESNYITGQVLTCSGGLVQ